MNNCKCTPDETTGWTTVVDLIKDLKAQRDQLARKDNKIRLLRKALTRMVAEFDTVTPVIPNQKEAARYANNLLQSNDE